MDFPPRPVSASTSPLQGRKVEKSKKIDISSKIEQCDLPARGRKDEKSKKLNIFSKFDHFDIPPSTKTPKCRKAKNFQYIQ